MSNPWFRFYTEAVDDDKLRLVAFEDRWHFVALLCLKGKGILDSEADMKLLARRVAVRLGLSVTELDRVAKTLDEVGLIDRETFQPLAWEERQFQSDTSKDRTRAYRERLKGKRHSDVTVTAQETETDTDTEEETDKKKTKATVVATPEGVSDFVWADFKKLRTAKKAPITQTALNGIAREAAKAGVSLDEALKTCCERGWTGFKADWLQEKLAARASSQGASETAYQRSMRLRMQEAVPSIAASAPSIAHTEFFRTIEQVEVLR